MSVIPMTYQLKPLIIFGPYLVGLTFNFLENANVKLKQVELEGTLHIILSNVFV